MRSYTTATGERRVWYADDDIERIAEAELAKARLLPTVSRPAVDIERFVEKYLGARLDQHAELDADTLGVTEFFIGSEPRIGINKDLTDALDDDPRPGLPGRWRATVAHEAAHVVLHRDLYDPRVENLDLFAAMPSEPAPAKALHRCLKRDVGYEQNGRSDWREVQANKGMAALLMPRGVFGELARREISSAYRVATVLPEDAAAVAARLADRFEVSRQAAEIRLKTLGFVRLRGQQTL